MCQTRSTASTLIVRCERLHLMRGGQPVLSDICVDVCAGDVIGIIGRNGAGKSSLIETLLGFHRPSSGRVELWGQAARDIGAWHKRRIGFVPQQDELLDGLSAQQHVHLLAAFYPDWDPQVIARLSDAWQLPLHRPVQNYSLGQRQKLSIMLALAAQPTLLLLDEPVASLDPLARAQFLSEMTALASRPERAMLLSSHIVGDLDALVNRIWVIDNGRLRWQGDIEALAAWLGESGVRPANLETAFRQLLA